MTYFNIRFVSKNTNVQSNQIRGCISRVLCLRSTLMINIFLLIFQFISSISELFGNITKPLYSQNQKSKYVFCNLYWNIPFWNNIDCNPLRSSFSLVLVLFRPLDARHEILWFKSLQISAGTVRADWNIEIIFVEFI